MKNAFFFLAAACIAINVGAQERRIMNSSFQQAPGAYRVDVQSLHRDFMEKRMAASTSGAHKTTSGSSRWYNYGVYMDLWAAAGVALGGSDYVYGYDEEIWNDTFGIIGYTSGPAHLNLVSIGNLLDPTFSGFNNVSLYTGTPAPMQITANDAYTVDSVVVPGTYFFGTKSNASVVDTLRLAFVYGVPGASSASSVFTSGLGGGGHFGTDNFFNYAYDSVKNRASGTSGGAPAQYMDILLHNSDTSTINNFTKAFQIVDASGSPAPINVPKGALIGCSITFKSGQAGIFSGLPGDTLIGAVAPFTRYNMFRPIVDYYTQTSPPYTTTIPAAEWPYYGVTTPAPNADLNDGMFKNLPNTSPKNWNNEYIPLWAWSSSSGAAASILQYPEVGYHITCATCNAVSLAVGSNTVSSDIINVYPNPAANELNIKFSLNRVSDVSVTLTNMVGRVVAAKNINNTASGDVLFNTATIPSGIYFYTFSANGTRSTGRIAITH